jgi:hypothetical protein
MEQLILYPHGSYLSSSPSADIPLVSTDSTAILDLSSRKQLTINTEKQSRSRSDSEHSTEPLTDPSSISLSTLTRKRNNLSESEVPNESTGGITGSSISPSSAPPTPIPLTTTATTNKSNLARTAILLAAKRAACNNNHTNNYDGSAFTLIDGTEDETDSSAGLFKQRFDFIDFTDEVNKLFSFEIEF